MNKKEKERSTPLGEDQEKSTTSSRATAADLDVIAATHEAVCKGNRVRKRLGLRPYVIDKAVEDKDE